MKQQTVSKMERVQTAVEWFAFQIMDSWNDIQNGKTSIDKLIEQAKQMEKEQIIKSVEYGCSDWGSAKDAKQYYNETYQNK